MLRFDSWVHTAKYLLVVLCIYHENNTPPLYRILPQPCRHHQRLQLILSTVCYAHGLSQSFHIPSLLSDALSCSHSAPATSPSDLQVYHRAFALLPWLGMIFLSMWLTHLPTRLLGFIYLVAILHYCME